MGELQQKYLEYTNIDEIIVQANNFIYTILNRALEDITLENVNSQSFTIDDLIMINDKIPDKIITKKSDKDIESLYEKYIQSGGKRSRNIRRSKRSRNIRRSKRSRNIRRSKKY